MADSTAEGVWESDHMMVNCPVNSFPMSNLSVENAERMKQLLRTGSVVDETPYPKFPVMKSEQIRLTSFHSWPPTAPLRPEELSEAGFFYSGQRDVVQCFCCGGMLGNWENGDTAWGEHEKHSSNCFFILGHDVGNVPLEQVGEGSGGSQPTTSQRNMETFEGRLASFEGIQHPVDPFRLARAGFCSTGREDAVMCFSCSGGLKDWQPEEDPWEEHAKYYPGCNFLLSEKGPEFVNTVQLRKSQQNKASSSQRTTTSTKEALRAEMARKVVEMGIDPDVVERVMSGKIQTGSEYISVEALVSDCLAAQEDDERTENQDEDPLEKLRRLQQEKQCKICMDRDIAVVFIPCGHLVSCRQCSDSLTKCPICCQPIAQKIKTFMA